MLESVVQTPDTGDWFSVINVCGAHNAMPFDQENPHIVVYREVGAKN